MSDVYASLRDIVRSGAKPAARELTYEPDAGVSEAPVDPVRLAAALGGRTLETVHGPCVVIDRRYAPERWHGHQQVGDCARAIGPGLAWLDVSLGPVADAVSADVWPMAGRPRRIFLDLETTGLSGGAGTVAFVVGLGWFDGDAFQVRQFLLTSYAAERALLAAVGDFVRDVELVVTFNGKTFDVPVMETRWLFHRLEPPLVGARHFDMLHPARRLWRGRVGPDVVGREATCSLGALERTLVGVERTGDVPGFEIPSRYFRFLRSGDPRPLEPILEHNRLDLLSLAAVVARAVRLVEGGPDACGDERECLALGKIYERANRHDRAMVCYSRASEETADSAVRAEAWYRLAVRHRRIGCHTEAAACWMRILELRAGPSIAGLRRHALQALAIHHEHRAYNLPAARELAFEALRAGDNPRWREAVRHRLARLDRRIAGRSPVHDKGGPETAPLLDAARKGEG